MEQKELIGPRKFLKLARVPRPVFKAVSDTWVHDGL